VAHSSVGITGPFCLHFFLSHLTLHFVASQFQCAKFRPMLWVGGEKKGMLERAVQENASITFAASLPTRPSQSIAHRLASKPARCWGQDPLAARPTPFLSSLLSFKSLFAHSLPSWIAVRPDILSPRPVRPHKRPLSDIEPECVPAIKHPRLSPFPSPTPSTKDQPLKVPYPSRCSSSTSSRPRSTSK